MALKKEILIINGAAIDGESPLPKFRERHPTIPPVIGEMPVELARGAGCHMKVLPYTVQDRYSRNRVPMKLKCIVLENEYLRAEFLPEYGGRLHSLFDKKRGKDLLFTNTVIQPCNLAIRNAWLSGGIEWNIGSIGHTFTTCDNIFCAVLKDENGEDFIRIYEFERLKSVFWQADFHLPEDSPYLITHVKLINPFPIATTTYWWSNVAVPDEGKTRILSSGRKVISFVGSNMKYETLPHIDAINGDPSFPWVAKRSFDYFITPNYEEECTWEAAVYDGGAVFFERSTPPLSFKKLYGWGSHPSGIRWQEFLSEDKGGLYAEIQAGIAPSQLHDKLFDANSKYEWTQIFGGAEGNADTLFGEYEGAVSYLDSIVDGIITGEDLYALDERLCRLASLPVSADMLLHCGSGFGALERLRMAIDKDGVVPESMCFPDFTIGEREYPWYHLLTYGILPVCDPRHIKTSFMISEKWLPHMEAALGRNGGEHWYSLYHYGVALYEGIDHTVFASEACTDEDIERRASLAEAAFKKSVALSPNHLAYRCLGVIEKQRENYAKAEEYYTLAMQTDAAYDDFSLLNEYIEILCITKKYTLAFAEYEKAPERIRNEDRVRVSAAMAAVKLYNVDYLEEFFSQTHHVIREGEDTLTDIWFEYVARRLAAERGLEPTEQTINELIDVAWESYPPEGRHDFRQSQSREERYRL